MIKYLDIYYKKLKPYIKIVFSIFILLILSIFILIISEQDKQGVLQVDFLDIGQGDASLIITPEGQKILIDNGPNYISSQKVESVLGSFWNKLDMAILTHPDLDHVGGTQDVINNFKPSVLLESTENIYQIYDNIKISQVLKVNNSHKLALNKGFSIEILSPDLKMSGSDNHKSVVNRVTYGNYEFIFMADADVEVERKLVSQGVFDKKSTKILKIGHHGSDTSSSEIFLKKLKPEYCVISVGKDNKYKHPNGEVLLRLQKYCKNIYRTDLDGDVSFKTDGENLKIDKTK